MTMVTIMVGTKTIKIVNIESDINNRSKFHKAPSGAFFNDVIYEYK